MANGQGSGESRQGLSTQLLHRPFKMEPGSNETWKKRSLLLFHELSLHVKPRWRNWKDFIWKNFPIYGSVCSDACHKRAIWGMLDGKFPSNIPQIPLEMICLLETKLVASSSFPAISSIGRGLSEETWRDMQQHAGVSNVTWSIVWRLRNLSLFRPLHLSPLSVETVSMWRRRSASQVDPGQSTGRRHPTGLKSSLHFFSLRRDSFCVLKLHFTSWWFKKHIPPFLFSLTVLLCIGYWLLQLIMRCFRFMVEHDEQQRNRFPF